ncbi:MAG: redox-sensing transcriptional repressor Rex [Spirochaetes bacterium GWD1_27_9]|nr:MAG: redox-sensing transcriptional repressor Rex [Spirochaetes bacterium GWC1_27_15]OHD41308.1 MAG: redox-sensing transcriptional repressor Rex [Spirochaetes bacterium GWD1_27_9]
MFNNRNTILRLSKYKKALVRLKSLGFIKVFSENLSDAVGVDSSQVRKDFALFDISGTKKGGYLIDNLIEKLNEVLGKGEVENVIIVGAGNIGTALMKYKGFEKEGVKVVCAFDNNPSKINKDSDIPVLPIEELTNYIKENKIKTAIMAIPDLFAQQILDLMIEAGIKGLLNFVPIHLRVPDDFVISNVNLEMELDTVLYYVNAIENQKKEKK